MPIITKKHFWTAAGFALLYVLLGQYAVTKIPHPFLGSEYIAFNMTVIVFAGIVFGRRTGALTGFFGSILTMILTLIIPTSQPGEIWFAVGNMIPHTVMGWAAGAMAIRWGAFAGSLSIIIGHALNIIAFTLLGLFTIAQFDLLFWKAIAFETLIDIIIINVFYHIFLISFPATKKRW